MGEADITEFVLRLVIIAVFTVMVVWGLLTLTEFRATIKTSSMLRLGMDFGENVLASSCTADAKGILSETKLNAEKASSDAGRNGLSGFSCIKIPFKARTLIRAKNGGEERKWVFGFDEGRSYENVREFPAAVIMSDGNVAPAVVDIVVETSVDCDRGNSGNNCFNCIEQKGCEAAECKWSPPNIATGYRGMCASI